MIVGILNFKQFTGQKIIEGCAFMVGVDGTVLLLSIYSYVSCQRRVRQVQARVALRERYQVPGNLAFRSCATSNE